MKPIWKSGWFWVSAILLIVAVIRVFYLETVGVFDYYAVIVTLVFFVFEVFEYLVKRKKEEKINNTDILEIG